MKTKIRNHRLLSVVTAFMLVLTMIPFNFVVTAQGTYENGFDTETGAYEPCNYYAGAYQIANAGNLYWFAHRVNSGDTSANAVLVDDITVDTRNLSHATGSETDDAKYKAWTPIGLNNAAYTGNFDGKKKNIRGLYYHSDTSYAGLFGNVNGAVISNVTVACSYLHCTSDNGYAGAIAGYVSKGEIKNCMVGQIKVTEDGMDGVAGAVVGASGGTIDGCSTCINFSIKGKAASGGIVGENDGGTVKNCTNNCELASLSNNLIRAGICGLNKGVIENCANYGNIFGDFNVGGIVGVSSSGTISGCINRGDISTSNESTSYYAGGICGKIGTDISNTSKVENCYSTGAVTASSVSNAYPIGYVSKDSSIANSYYLNDTTVSNEESGVIKKTAAEFASGEVCYALNGNQSTLVFGQNLDNGETPEAYPVFLNASKSNQVFVPTGTNCAGVLPAYSNKSVVTVEHSYVNGICKYCDKYEPCGTDESGIYAIANAGNLYWFAALVNGDTTATGGVLQNTSAKAVLTADIMVNTGAVGTCGGTKDAGWREWTPIGLYNGTNTVEYAGNFDGQNHTISGLYYNSDTSYAGLFGFLYNSDAVVENVIIDNSYFNCTIAEKYSGCIVGYVWEGKVNNCVTKSSTVAGNNCYSGGIVAYLRNGSVENCTNISTIIVDGYYAGGVVGQSNDDALVKGCTNTATLNDVSGGIVGRSSGNVENCINTGNISSTKETGGITGPGLTGILKNCINTGNISTSGTDVRIFAGGIVGSLGVGAYNGTVQNCYSTGNVTAAVAGNAYPIGCLADKNIGSKLINNYYLSSALTDKYDGTTSKTQAQFKSGEVCYALNGDQETINFVQNLESDDYPVLLSETDTETVYQVTFKQYGDTEGTNTKYAYTNTNGKVTIPTEFENMNLRVLDTDGNLTDETFTADTAVTANITVSNIPAPEYTVTIPEKIEFGECSRELENASSKDKYKMKAFDIHYSSQYLYLNNYEVNITVNSDFKLTDGTNTVDYFFAYSYPKYYENNNYNFMKIRNNERIMQLLLLATQNAKIVTLSSFELNLLKCG